MFRLAAMAARLSVDLSSEMIQVGMAAKASEDAWKGGSCLLPLSIPSQFVCEGLRLRRYPLQEE